MATDELEKWKKVSRNWKIRISNAFVSSLLEFLCAFSTTAKYRMLIYWRNYSGSVWSIGTSTMVFYFFFFLWLHLLKGCIFATKKKMLHWHRLRWWCTEKLLCWLGKFFKKKNNVQNLIIVASLFNNLQNQKPDNIHPVIPFFR